EALLEGLPEGCGGVDHGLVAHLRAAQPLDRVDPGLDRVHDRAGLDPGPVVEDTAGRGPGRAPDRTRGAAGGIRPGLSRADQQGAGPCPGLERLLRSGRRALGAVGHALAVVAVAGDRVDPAQLLLLARADRAEQLEDLGDLRRSRAGLLGGLWGLVGPGLPEGGAA